MDLRPFLPRNIACAKWEVGGGRCEVGDAQRAPARDHAVGEVREAGGARGRAGDQRAYVGKIWGRPGYQQKATTRGTREVDVCSVERRQERR